jgi:hypothetical protein
MKRTSALPVGAVALDAEVFIVINPNVSALVLVAQASACGF